MEGGEDFNTDKGGERKRLKEGNEEELERRSMDKKVNKEEAEEEKDL